MEKGLVIVLTGDGKGKTTSALGMALRAAGQDFSVAIIQFVKGGKFYGEHNALENFKGITIRSLGLGMLLNSPYGLERHRERAEIACEEAREAIHSGDYQMVILDEIIFAVRAGLLPEEKVLTLMREKPESIHLILTGRGATPAMIAAADTVTEMVVQKHHHGLVKDPLKGIEY